MKFKMNNRTWDILELDQKKFWEADGKIQTEKDGDFFGRCLFKDQEIWLDKELTTEQKRQTLMHELMHCYIGSYLTYNVDSYTEDTLCDISANSHDIIDKIVNDYFKEVK